MTRRQGFKMLGRTVRAGLELRTQHHDFYLRWDPKGQQWTVDVFDRTPQHAEEAHLGSEGFHDLAGALSYIGGWGE